MNYAIRHTGKDNLEDDEEPYSWHSKDPCCPENSQFTTVGKKRTGSYGGRAYSDPSTYEKDPYCLEHGKYERRSGKQY